MLRPVFNWNWAAAFAAVLATVACATADAAEIEDMLGRWSAGLADDCLQPANSEAAPFAISKDGQGTHFGTYGWLCTVSSWTADGQFLKGSGECASEGGDDPSADEFRIGLAADGQLVLASRASISVYQRCKAGK